MSLTDFPPGDQPIETLQLLQGKLVPPQVPVARYEQNAWLPAAALDLPGTRDAVPVSSLHADDAPALRG
jgi:hypothetical protein